MKLSLSYKPEFESLKELLIQITSERSTDVLLKTIVESMVLRPHIALVRIWLKKQGDHCKDCHMASHCSKNIECLHLSASSGESICKKKNNWSSIIGPMKRVPINFSTIGRVADKKRALTKTEIENEIDWQEKDIWAKGEKIIGFGAHPLLYKDEMLGVIAIYSRIKADRVKEGKFWVQMIAHSAAATIANAKAFNEIDHLKSQLELENAYLKEEIKEASAFGDIIGKSPHLMNILNQIELVAPTNANVFIFGESGTGKELIAREIHKRSLRKKMPLIKVNCATIPRELYESEFFGHIKGAFTGAIKNRAGRFQAADKGTLFLDEIGELPIELQSKLLRVLQEGTYERIGEDITRRVNVRIIAATNRKIKQDIKQGKFREDLYYRLNVFPIHIAPLRDRKEDIKMLAYHFLKKISLEMQRIAPNISRANMKKLISYAWPGNVRELRNIIERSVITSQDGQLDFNISGYTSEPDNNLGKPEFNKPAKKILTDQEMNLMSKENILNAIKICDGKIYGKNGAASLLNIPPTTLCS
ncbi:MAG: AAA family ATPase, partial [Desulfobacteraceae bacterium]|nr:AAA family ATPase [Desulfobacteraceae bacterium]